MKGAINMKAEKIEHIVIFSLKHDKGSLEEEKFLGDSESILSPITGVKNFKVLKQISPNNDYDFGFTMEFDDKLAYETYLTHPTHVSYVKKRWLKEVSKFLEIDFKILE